MVVNELDFESARNKAILNVMKKDRQKYTQLQSDYNVLKHQHLNFLEEAAEEKIKRAEQMIKLKQKNKFLKDQIKSLKQNIYDLEDHCKNYQIQREKDTEEYNKLLELEQRKGWNELK